MMRLRSTSALVMLLVPLGGCAWSNPDNRPVWNAFESSLVPEDDGLFYATLPVTVPLGVGAILTDTFVAHPIQVVDDSWRDAGELWDEEDLDFEREYYTQLAFLPFRAVFTPVAFAGSWFGRSVFDIPRHNPELSKQEQLALEEQQRREQEEMEREIREQQFEAFEQWLRDGSRRRGRAPRLERWDARLGEALRLALAGDAEGRRRLHVGMLRAKMAVFGPYDAREALRDADPVVRFSALQHWSDDWSVEAGLRTALRDDPVETVRLAARARWSR